MSDRQKLFVWAMMGISFIFGLALTPLYPQFALVLLINVVCCAIVLAFGSDEGVL